MEEKCNDSGYCICVHCDKRVLHQKGNPCREQHCPNCGHTMLRENSYHHQLYLKNKKEHERSNRSANPK